MIWMTVGKRLCGGARRAGRVKENRKQKTGVEQEERLRGVVPVRRPYHRRYVMDDGMDDGMVRYVPSPVRPLVRNVMDDGMDDGSVARTMNRAGIGQFGIRTMIVNLGRVHKQPNECLLRALRQA